MSLITKEVDFVVKELRKVAICDGCRIEGMMPDGFSVPDGWMYIKVQDSHEPAGTTGHILHACSPHCGIEVMHGLARLTVTA